VLNPSKIVCVGRNYVDHAAELGNVVPDRPLLFLKPPSALIEAGQEIVLPGASKRVEHEGEIGVVVERRMKGVSEDEALACVRGITCVNDVTARDLQRLDGQWTRAKGFDTFCPVGPRVVPLAEFSDVGSIELFCRVNGAERQRGISRDMAFQIPAILSYISHVMTLFPGDLVATGTPAGVGPLQIGDAVEVEIPGVGVLRNPVVGE
jgi:2-keto-4-pentenoate hydratase/2-oxohepta-3-ene-1,7-dioic acid hydratase in catechol pathway